MRRNECADLLVIDELSDSRANDGGVIGYDCKVLYAFLNEVVHDRMGRPAPHEASDHECGPVLYPVQYRIHINEFSHEKNPSVK
jgi:hypothetical protein